MNNRRQNRATGRDGEGRFIRDNEQEAGNSRNSRYSSNNNFPSSRSNEERRFPPGPVIYPETASQNYRSGRDDYYEGRPSRSNRDDYYDRPSRSSGNTQGNYGRGDDYYENSGSQDSRDYDDYGSSARYSSSRSNRQSGSGDYENRNYRDSSDDYYENRSLRSERDDNDYDRPSSSRNRSGVDFPENRTSGIGYQGRSHSDRGENYGRASYSDTSNRSRNSQADYGIDWDPDISSKEGQASNRQQETQGEESTGSSSGAKKRKITGTTGRNTQETSDRDEA